MARGCDPDRFGYWWKWYPERVRPDAPEWITWDINSLYGEYLSLVDQEKRLYSGVISLPPRVGYMKQVLEVLRHQPLALNHDGRINMSEQGVIACAFGALGQSRFHFRNSPSPALLRKHWTIDRQGPI